MTPAPALHKLAEGPRAPVHFAGTAFKGDQSSGKPRHAQQAAPGHDARMSEIAHQFQGALALIIRTFGCGVRRGYRPLRGLASSLWVSFLLADDCCGGKEKNEVDHLQAWSGAPKSQRAMRSCRSELRAAGRTVLQSLPWQFTTTDSIGPNFKLNDHVLNDCVSARANFGPRRHEPK
jgi:hypothetical protein